MAKGSVNKVIVLGRLGQDPEVKTTNSGSQVVNLSVATTELGRKDATTGIRGEDQTEWHRVTIFGKMAENAAQYLKKGSQVYIEGRLNTRKWQDQNGQDRYSTDIIANEMQFMSGKSDNNQGQQGHQQPQQQQNNQQQQQQYNQPPQQQAPQQQATQQNYNQNQPVPPQPQNQPYNPNNGQ